MNERFGELPPDEVPMGFGVEGVDDKKYEAPGAPAQHERGVQYQGSYEADNDGNARAVRLHARALAAAGEPVLLQSFSNTFIDKSGARVGAESMEPSIKAEVADLRNASIGKTDVRVKHMVIASADQIRYHVVPRSLSVEHDIERAIATTQALFATTIVYSVWERTKLDAEVASLLARVGECWVPCQQNADLLRQHGVERVVVVPHPWEETSQIAKCSLRQHTGFDPRGRHDRKFYSIGLWQPRKGFHELIGAFLMAYKPGGGARLTIKHVDTKFPGYPRPAESVEHWLSDPNVRARGWRRENLAPHLWLPGGYWPESEIVRLHFRNNIYVSASHGEGFGIPAFDAKVAGNRLVHVGWGGTADFADEESGDVSIPYDFEPVPETYGWSAGNQWAAYTMDALVEALARATPPERFARTPKLEKMRFQNVGELMRERVQVIRERNKQS